MALVHSPDQSKLIIRDRLQAISLTTLQPLIKQDLAGSGKISFEMLRYLHMLHRGRER